jgi:hypothetical protein
MHGDASERLVYDRIADAIGEALRTLAHDAANCAAVFDMEVGEVTAVSPEAGDALVAATDRLRTHVQDIRTLAAAKGAEGASLEEVLTLALRLLSRTARRDLSRTPGERLACHVHAPQLPVLLGLLVVLREILRATGGAGLARASVAADGDSGVILLEVAMEEAPFAELLAIANGAFSQIARVAHLATRTEGDPVHVMAIGFSME